MKDNNSNNIGLQTDNPITEKFHELLAANTKKLNDLRLEYAQRMADAKDEYDKAVNGLFYITASFTLISVILMSFESEYSVLYWKWKCK